MLLKWLVSETMATLQRGHLVGACVDAAPTQRGVCVEAAPTQRIDLSPHCAMLPRYHEVAIKCQKNRPNLRAP